MAALPHGSNGSPPSRKQWQPSLTEAMAALPHASDTSARPPALHKTLTHERVERRVDALLAAQRPRLPVAQPEGGSGQAVVRAGQALLDGQGTGARHGCWYGCWKQGMQPPMGAAKGIRM
jgi:hypothetical protein